MTRFPANILLRIEQLLSSGKQQEARLLLVEYLKLNPASARAWWLMTLTLTDLNQQMDCLLRVLRLDPEFEPARERLAKLVSQQPVSPSVNPFTALSLDPDEEEPTRDVSNAPVRASTPKVVVETVPVQSETEQTSSPVPPTPVEPAGSETHPPKAKSKLEIGFIVLTVFAICAIVALAAVFSLQRKSLAEAQAHNLQETVALAQTLTNLPLPTLIPTWTASPTLTALPTRAFTRTSTLIPTLQYTLTRTPRPSSLIGPVVGLYAPDFSLTDLGSGQQVTLSQFDGQPVLLFFWATWCPYCNNEMDSIKTIAQTYNDIGLVVLTINAAEDYATVSSFQSTHLLTFPILLDPDSDVQSAYQVDAIPRHFFVNSSGRVAFIGVGEMTLNEMTVQVDAIMRRYPTATP